MLCTFTSVFEYNINLAEQHMNSNFDEDKTKHLSGA